MHLHMTDRIFYSMHADMGATLTSLVILDSLLCSCVSTTYGSTGCGGYFELSAGEVRYFGVTPGYAPYSNCVWLIEAPSGYQVKLHILSFVGQTYDGSCVDYINAKNGYVTQDDILAETCANQTNTNVTTQARWLYLRFKADASVATGSLSVATTTVLAGSSIDNFTSPIKACKSFEFRCSNLVCVPRSYLCDDFNDCGCEVNCDEQNCDGLGMDRYDRMGMSIGIGLGFFICIFIGVLIWERRRRRIAKQKEREERMKEEGRSRPSGKNKKDDKKDKKSKKKKKDIYWIS